MSSAVVVGAGAGGLVAAWELTRAGIDVTLLDAWRGPGGMLARSELDGLELDVGAEGYSIRGGGVAALLADLGADEEIVQPNPAGAWLQTADGPRPIPRRLVFGLPADPGADDVRAVVGELPAPASGASGPSASLADLTRSWYGQRVLDDLVTPLVGGVYSTSADHVTLAELAPDVAARVAAGAPLRDAVTKVAAHVPPGGAVYGIRGGMFRLADLLVASSAASSGSFELGCDEAVTGLERVHGGWRVTTARRVLSAPMLVLAVPPDAAARLLGAPVAPAGVRIELVTLVLEAPGFDRVEPRGTGVLVAANVPDVRAKALTHSTAKWPWLREAAAGRDVLRLSYGRRGQAPATAGLDQAELTALATADAAALLGRPIPEPVAVRRTGWSVLPPGTPGLGIAREWLTEQRTDGLALVGAGIAGVGLAAVVPHARAEIDRLTRSIDG